MTKITQINATTGEVVEREMNAEELTQQAIDVAEQEAKTAAAEQAKLDKEALLTKLGITADEAKLLLS